MLFQNGGSFTSIFGNLRQHLLGHLIKGDIRGRQNGVSAFSIENFIKSGILQIKMHSLQLKKFITKSVPFILYLKK